MLQSRRAILVLALVLAAAGCQMQPGAPGRASDAALGNSAGDGMQQMARAEVALERGNLSNARDAFTAAMRLRPDDPKPALGLAETYFALGDLATAARLLDVVERSGSLWTGGRTAQARGMIALAESRLSEAEDHFAQAVNTDPALWRAWIGLGRTRARGRDWVGARAAFVEAEGRAPRDASISNDIGMSFLAEQLPDQAIPHFERALAASPEDETARANLRIARSMVGDYDEAVAGAGPRELADTLNNAGYIAILNGDFDVADRLLRRAVEASAVYHAAAVANLDLLMQSRARAVPTAALAEAAPRAPVHRALPTPQPEADPHPKAIPGIEPTRLPPPSSKPSFAAGVRDSMRRRPLDILPPLNPDSALVAVSKEASKQPNPKEPSAERKRSDQPEELIRASPGSDFKWEAKPTAAQKAISERAESPVEDLPEEGFNWEVEPVATR